MERIRKLKYWTLTLSSEVNSCGVGIKSAPEQCMVIRMIPEDVRAPYNEFTLDEKNFDELCKKLKGYYFSKKVEDVIDFCAFDKVDVEDSKQ